jgi:hypothetical protein
MPIKITGSAFPIKDLITLGAAAFWLAALSFQVNANGDEIKKQAETKERLTAIEVTQKVQNEDTKEIKEEQKEQRKILVEILQKVSQ